MCTSACTDKSFDSRQFYTLLYSNFISAVDMSSRSAGISVKKEKEKKKEKSCDSTEASLKGKVIPDGNKNFISLLACISMVF